ncbi:MAG: hypothetical protein ACRDVW_00530 [Acidimicrobiales bacterium]
MTGEFHVHVASTPPPDADAWIVTGGPGSIGYWDDEFVVIAPPERTPPQGARPLVPTVRPLSSERPAVSGVVALRDFAVSAQDLDEFVDLSAGAWDSFEATYDTTVLGLFRRADVTGSEVSLLLVTRYASLAVWEQSRSAVPARAGRVAEAGVRFRRRRQITARTSVRLGPIVSGR